MEGHKKTALNFLLLTLNINSEVDDYVLQCLKKNEWIKESRKKSVSLEDNYLKGGFLWTLHKLCENKGFHWPVFSSI